jgi:hypothetical protein
MVVEGETMEIGDVLEEATVWTDSFTWKMWVDLHADDGLADEEGVGG